MPELPEVETVRRGLVPLCQGRTISLVKVSHPRTTRRDANQRTFARRLKGQRIVSVERRGKYLWFTLANTNQCLVAHLGLSGQFRPAVSGQKVAHERARISFDDHRPDLVFCDQRTFGGLYLDELVAQKTPAGAPDKQNVPSSVAHIALDPFDPKFTRQPVVDRLRQRNVAIKTALLDQTVISGVGNIYADESLWRSKIHPLTRAKRLSGRRIDELLTHVNDVLFEALGSGGTTFDGLYVSVNGESGEFSQRLAAYGRGGKPCQRCGATLRREKFANRSSVRCPKCQPAPRHLSHKVDS